MTKKKMLIILMALVVLGTSATVAFAEGKEKTYCGKSVACLLDTDFSIFVWGRDEASAITSWDGVTNRSVKAKLYWCDTAFSSYELIDTDTEATYARAYGYRISVWKFKSEHYGGTNSDSEENFLVELTDW